MGKITGFLEIDRQEPKYAPAADRIRHYSEFAVPLEERELVRQAARCMDCGVPYCHTAAVGCNFPIRSFKLFSSCRSPFKSVHKCSRSPAFLV